MHYLPILLLCFQFVTCTLFGAESFRNSFLKDLHDLEQVDKIVSEFETFSKRAALSKKQAKAMKQKLYRNRLFLGSKFYNHALLCKGLPKRAKGIKFRQFVKNIRANESFKKRLATAKKNITILYTGSYGGGHKMPAQTLAKHFERGGHQVQLVDVDQIADVYSPRIDGYTRAQIYQEVYQKEGNVEKAHDLKRRIDAAQSVESKVYLADLKRIISDFATDHIFTVAHHKPILGYLSYQLGVPMTFVHTDFSFKGKLIPLMKKQKKLKKPLITFATVNESKSFLKNVLKEFHCKKKALPKAIKQQIVSLGFPVRESFVPVTQEQKDAIRESLGIERYSTVVKLAMGQNGLAKEINDILVKILQDECLLDNPLQLFVICGKNEKLKAELDQAQFASDKIVVHILGFMDEAEMAKIDKASDVWITKPGGSTCAELVQTQKQMLYVLNPHHPWENINADYLRSIGLAGEYNPRRSLVTQIKDRQKQGKKLKQKYLPKNNWQGNADRIVKKQAKR